MDSLHVTFTTFGIICAAIASGFILRRLLHEHHLSPQTQDAVKLATGIIATLAALVLGLLVASGKQGFDSRAAEARTFVINLTLLDRSMRLYQPPLTEERTAMAKFAEDMRDKLWNEDSRLGNNDALSQLDQIRNKFRNLDPQTLQDQSLKARYMSLSDGLILAANELLQDGNDIPPAFVVIVDAWLAIIFLGFGLFAPFNRVSIAALVIAAAAVALSLLIIIEMSEPFQGLITISPKMMDEGIAQIKS